MKLFLIIFIFTIAGQAQTKLALNWKAESEFGGFYEALQQGLYKKNGLNVEILEGGSGSPTTQMLMNKTVDFAIVSAEEIVLAADRDPKRKLVAVFTVFETSPYMIMAHESAQATDLKSLFQDESMTISLQKGLPYVDFLLKKFAPTKAKLVPYTGGIGYFESNQKSAQQGFITSETLLAEQKKIKTKTWLVADQGFNPYITVLAVREEFLKQQPDTVKKFVRASREGLTLYLKSPSTTNKIMSQKNPSMTIEMMNQSLEKMRPLMKFEPLQVGQMKLDRWAALQTQMLELKLIKKPVAAETLFKNE